jgi:WD40 repeat protein
MYKAISGVCLALFWSGIFFATRGQASPSGKEVDASLNGPRLVVQLGHPGGIRHATFSPGERYIATAGTDRTVCLWDAATGMELRRFVGHTAEVDKVAFSPDGRLIVTSSVNDNFARIWDVATGKELRRLAAKFVNSVAFTGGGRFIVAGLNGASAIVWDAATGVEAKRLGGSKDWSQVVVASPDGRTIATAATIGDGITLWDAETGKEVRRLALDKGDVRQHVSLTFSRDGKYIAAGLWSRDDDVNSAAWVWEVETGREVRSFKTDTAGASDVAFSPDGQYLVAGTGHRGEGFLDPVHDCSVRLWGTSTGREVWRFGTQCGVSSVEFSESGGTILIAQGETATILDHSTGSKVKDFRGVGDAAAFVAAEETGLLVTGHGSGATRLWNSRAGSNVRRVKDFARGAQGLSWSMDGHHVLTPYLDGDEASLRLWDVATGLELGRVEHPPSDFATWSVTRDGHLLALGGPKTPISVRDVASGKEILRLEHAGKELRNFEFSHDGRLLLAGYSDGTADIFDVTGAKVLWHLEGHKSDVEGMSFSPDGRYAVTASRLSTDSEFKVWDTTTGRLVREFKDHSIDKHVVMMWVYRWNLWPVISPDNRYLAAGSWGHTARLWDITTGEEVSRLTGHMGEIQALSFTPDARFLVTASLDATLRVWDVKTGREVCRLISFADGTWAIVDAEGRYDASNGGEVEGLHWVVGNEAISLKQLKERYYDPGLLAKILGYSREPLRDVNAFREVRLFPSVSYDAPKPGSTKITLRLVNRGGGIGRVRVSVNDKEVTPDARGTGFNTQAAEAALTVDLGRSLVINGEKNVISVTVWNQEGYLSSTSVERVWVPPGRAETRQPELYAIVAGISNYSNSDLDLHYAAKDASDMATALELGAKRLFGVEKVHLTLLSTEPDPRAVVPTKENFRAAFARAERAKPWDVLVVYLAGHGVALRGGRDLYCYLTREARSKDDEALSDPQVRAQTSVTSDELVEWIKRVPALKQVMVLDTCAAGTAGAKLAERREVSGDQVRAIERMKDRTGFHILMGSAADAVSYEATRYGQGLLTYALLQAMRGAKLRDGEFADVSELFQYAADEVPRLAADVGGIQRPIVAAPLGTSFDIGRFTKDEQALVPLAQVKPLMLKPRLIDPEQGFDELGLEEALRRSLREAGYATTRGQAGDDATAGYVYVDADDMPGALRPSGTYVVSGEIVTVTLNLIRDGKKVASYQARGDRRSLKTLTDNLTRHLIEELTRLP